MIDVTGSAITDEIVRRLKDADIFAVMADETPDASHKEHATLPYCSLCVSSRNRREITCSSNSR